MSSIWEKYAWKRYIAQVNLNRIIGYQGLVINGPFNPQNIQEFKYGWGEKVNKIDGTGVFTQDAKAIPFLFPNGHAIVFRFIPSDSTKTKIPKVTVRMEVLEFFKLTTGLTGEQVMSAIELIPNRELILISDVPLEGGAKNEIAEFNNVLQFPIRYFTVDELQFDPTTHKTGPKRVDVLTPTEIVEYIERQRGLLLNGRVRLSDKFQEQLNEITDPWKREQFIMKSDEEILSQMQTINTNDPWVKWRGYRVGDVLRIIRRIGKTKVTYRRVILVEVLDLKPPKIKVSTTTK